MEPPIGRCSYAAQSSGLPVPAVQVSRHTGKPPSSVLLYWCGARGTTLICHLMGQVPLVIVLGCSLTTWCRDPAAASRVPGSCNQFAASHLLGRLLSVHRLPSAGQLLLHDLSPTLSLVARKRGGSARPSVPATLGGGRLPLLSLFFHHLPSLPSVMEQGKGVGGRPSKPVTPQGGVTSQLHQTPANSHAAGTCRNLCRSATCC